MVPNKIGYRLVMVTGFSPVSLKSMFLVKEPSSPPSPCLASISISSHCERHYHLYLGYVCTCGWGIGLPLLPAKMSVAIHQWLAKSEEEAQGAIGNAELACKKEPLHIWPNAANLCTISAWFSPTDTVPAFVMCCITLTFHDLRCVPCFYYKDRAV